MHPKTAEVGLMRCRISSSADNPRRTIVIPASLVHEYFAGLIPASRFTGLIVTGRPVRHRPRQRQAEPRLRAGPALLPRCTPRPHRDHGRGGATPRPPARAAARPRPPERVTRPGVPQTANPHVRWNG